MEKLAFILTVLCIFQDISYCVESECAQSFRNKVREIEKCIIYEPQNYVDNYSACSKKTFDYEIINSTTGLMKVRIPYCNCSNNDIYQLRVSNGISENECPNQSMSSLHSVRNMSNCQRITCENSSCIPLLELTYQHVFEGCYKIIHRKRNSNFQYKSEFIKTDYQKRPLNEQHLVLHVETIPSIQIGVGPVSVFGENDINLLFCGVKRSCKELNSDKCPAENTMSWVVSIENGNMSVSCNSKGQVIPDCTLENNVMKCKLYNLTTGEYCVMVQPKDERCEEHSLFTANSKNCVWKNDFEIVEPPEISSIVETNSGSFNTIYIVSGIAVGVIIIVILIGYTICKKFILIPHPARQTSKDLQEVKKLNQKILLLYPLDCPQFMDLMRIFRNILKTQLNFEVYDVFDSQRWNDIAVAPDVWIRNMVDDEEIKLIIVESPCSVLHQEATINHFYLRYHQPSTFCNLFTYGLRAAGLEKNVTNCYRKNYVIKFRGFETNNMSLKYLAPHRIFTLPGNLEKLLEHLCGSSYISLVRLCDESSQEMLKLKASLDKLIEYYRQNPEYLKSIICRV